MRRGSNVRDKASAAEQINSCVVGEIKKEEGRGERERPVNANYEEQQAIQLQQAGLIFISLMTEIP